MASPPLPSGTLTFLFTDIEGSTQLLNLLGEEFGSLLAEHHQLLRAAFGQHEGVEIDTQGDSFFIVFRQALQAVQAAALAQRSLAGHHWPKEAQVHVRMALHTGEPKIGPTGYVGMDVHRAARINSAGHGGQVLLSASTKALVEQVLPAGLSLRPLGEQRLKDLQRPEQIFQLVIDGLPSDFPELHSLNALPNNLPMQLTSFIGREEQIRVLKQYLQRDRMVTLVGAGGSGKTRLALQTAAELLDEFRDGVWFIDLSPSTDPAFIMQTLGTVLKVHEEAGHSYEETLLDFLRRRKTLIILDNCEHLVEACAALAESLLKNCPQLKVLSTSREALGIAGEYLLPVPTLSLPAVETHGAVGSKYLERITGSEAVRLFEERAVQVQPGFRVGPDNALAVARVCERLDGIPLAIELAAARVRMMSLEQILDRLNDRFHLLTGGSRTALPRQKTLQALVEWSHALLDGPEKQLFRRLSVFTGGWSLEAAEAVCSGDGIPDSAIMDLLERLVDKSLVLAETSGSEHYRMLETIRQYAALKLQDSGEEEHLRQRHFDHTFVQVRESQQGLTGPNPSKWLKNLDTEKDNVYNALAWGLQNVEGNREKILELTAGLWMWWMGRGTLNEGRQWLEKALQISPEPSAARAKALASLGIVLWHQGDIQKAFSYEDESLRILAGLEMPDLADHAQVTHVRGHLAMDSGDFLGAYQGFKESLGSYRQLNDPYWVGTLISDLGMVAYHQGDLKLARKYQEQSLEVFEEVGNEEIIAQTIARIGEIVRLEGDYTNAKECYEKSLSIYQALGMKVDAASCMHKLGYVAQYHGNFQKARSLFTASLSIQREVSNKQGIIECLAGMAGLAVVENQPERALRLYGAAQALRDATHFPLTPTDLAEWKRDQTLAEGQLDEAGRMRARLDGQAMGFEKAIEYALCDND
ncbi:MAG TPA: tetratricopeptide repeat protein [Anaerolineales bacterium]|jgi:predicted ATPase/class 3 adenylate cyclase